MRNFTLGLLVLCMLVGCAKPADPELAEQAVPPFHMALLDGDFDGIYRRAGAELKQQQAQPAFVTYLRKVRGALGEIQGADRTATRVEGTRVTLTYKSKYSVSEATEEFVIRAEEGKEPVLVSYRLLAPVLP